jgi:hypothetical protein
MELRRLIILKRKILPVPNLCPTLVIFGVCGEKYKIIIKSNSIRIAINYTLSVQNIPKFDKKMTKKYGKTFGYFDGTLPNLYTTDINLIKSVFVKDFDHFVNRRVNSP